METFGALSGREWDLLPAPGRAVRAGRDWARRRHLGQPATLGRDWLRSSTTLTEGPPLVPTLTPSGTKATRPPGRSKRVAAVLALAGLGAVAFAVDRPDDSGSNGEPAMIEPFIDSAELAPGSLYHLVDQIGARQLWESGVTGAGINVAVIDTGVAQVDSLDADGKIVAVVDLSNEGNDPANRFVDNNGHGTFMAGIIAGNETGIPAVDAVDAPQEFKGVAPDAGIVSVKVAGRDGATDPNDVVAGVNWVT
jgi:subtilisin family serine protease